MKYENEDPSSQHESKWIASTIKWGWSAQEYQFGRSLKANGLWWLSQMKKEQL